MRETCIAIAFVLLCSAAASTYAESAQTGIAACYSHKLVGHKTSSGQPYEPNKPTMGSAYFPLGTKVKITNLKNQRSTVAMVNDHMSARAGGRHHHLIADVSQEICRELAFPKGGEAKVSLEAVP